MLSSLLTQFRQQFPQGSLTSDLLTIHDGLYVVRVCAGVDSRILASGLGANTALEVAEDMATTRALERLGLAAEPQSHGVTTEASKAAIAKPNRGLANLDAILPERGFANALASPDQPNGESPQTAQPELAPPPLSLVPPALDREDALEQSAAERPMAAVAAPTLTSDPPFQAERPPTVEVQTNEFMNLSAEPAAIDLSDIIAQTDVELQRLGWGVTQGREFLEKTYGKRSRHDLTDDELLEFLLFLETQSPPDSA